MSLCPVPMLITLLSFIFYTGSVHSQFTASRNFWPAAYPLAVRSPYLNTWEQTPANATSLNIWPRHWNDQQINGWCGFVRVDGIAYEFFGEAGTNGTVLQSSTVTPTRSIFVVEAGPSILLNVTFLSPIEPDDYIRQSMAFMYLAVDVISRDGLQHNVSIYSDITAEWISGDRSNIAVWNTTVSGAASYHTVLRQTPEQFAEIKEQAEDAVVYYAMANRAGMTLQTGSDRLTRQQFEQHGQLTGAKDTKFRAISDDFVVLAISVDLGLITQTSSPIVWALGLVRDPVAQYALENVGNQLRSSFFWTKFTTIDAAISDFVSDFSNAFKRADTLDAKVMADAAAISPDYVDLISIATREAMAGIEITVGRNGGALDASDVKAFMKDLGNSRRINPVETLYAALPMFLYLNASLVGLLLEPLLQYQAGGLYTKGFAAPDLGMQYPLALGAAGATEPTAIENTGNMLIMTLAHAQYSGDGKLISKYYALLKKWAEYLSTNSLIPANQTEDGLNKANMTNLAIKGIIGVKCMAVMSQAAGQADDSKQFNDNATALAAQWVDLAVYDGHITSTYGSSVPTLTYNLYADQLLNLQLMNSSMYTSQTAFYDTQLAAAPPFGLPYDGDSLNVRSDWTLFTAGTANTAVTRKKFIASVRSHASFNQSRGAFANKYDGQTGSQSSGFGSPAQGAMFSLLALGIPRKEINVPAIPTNGAIPTSKTLSVGAIAGIVVAAVFVGGLLVSIGFFLWRRRHRQVQSQYRLDLDEEPLAMLSQYSPAPTPVVESHFGGTESTSSAYAHPSTVPIPPSPRTEEQNGAAPLRKAPLVVLSHDSLSAADHCVINTASRPRLLSQASSDQISEAAELRVEVESLRKEMAQLRDNIVPPPRYD